MKSGETSKSSRISLKRMAIDRKQVLKNKIKIEEVNAAAAVRVRRKVTRVNLNEDASSKCYLVQLKSKYLFIKRIREIGIHIAFNIAILKFESV